MLRGRFTAADGLIDVRDQDIEIDAGRAQEFSAARRRSLQ
jgi:hypothetical protein